MSVPPRPVRAGLWLLGSCSVLDVVALGLSDGETPPWAVAIAGAALGVVSLVLVIRALRGAGGVRLLIGLRILSALSAVPAFLVGDVPVAAVAGAAVVVVLNVVGVLLVAGGGRRVEVAP
jgi:hypothetical protein